MRFLLASIVVAVGCNPGSHEGGLVAAPTNGSASSSATSAVAAVKPDASASTGVARVSIACNVERGWALLYPPHSDAAQQASWQAVIIGDAASKSDSAMVDKARADAEALGAHVSRCDAKGIVFDVAPGEWDLMVATFTPVPTSRTVSKALHLSAGDDVSMSFRDADFPLPTNFGACCHCPFVAVWDPAAARYRTAFEVLRGRSSPALAGVERTPLTVVVRDHRVRIRIRELEDEVTFLDGVALETQAGATLAPVTRLASPTVLKRGDERIVEFFDPSLPDGESTVVLRVAGHYEPMAPRR
jgi:hypothetical protein